MSTDERNDAFAEDTEVDIEHAANPHDEEKKRSKDFSGLFDRVGCNLGNDGIAQ